MMKLFIGILLAAAYLQSNATSAKASSTADIAAAIVGAALGTGVATAIATNAIGASVIATAAAATSADTAFSFLPPSYSCRCPLIYQPVCGSDGQTYSNECVLKCFNAENVRNKRNPIFISRYGECPKQVCHCPAIYQPVCGTDGYTYSKECDLHCENNRRTKLHLPAIGIANRAKCPPAPCICSDVVIPVCGNNSVTYRNICFLQCANRRSQEQGNPHIYQAYSGACTQEYCACSREHKPICASDGNTFNSPCLLQCENRRRNTLGLYALKIRNDGPCYSCNCPAVDDPLCVEDDQTYKNPCFFRCENFARARIGLPLLKIMYKGICGCACRKNVDPVCGSDDQTYDNICLLHCESNRRKYQGKDAIWLAYGSPCVCNCSNCPTKYEPMCGSNGRTYWNRCWLECYSDCNLRRNFRKILQVSIGYCLGSK